MSLGYENKEEEEKSSCLLCNWRKKKQVKVKFFPVDQYFCLDLHINEEVFSLKMIEDDDDFFFGSLISQFPRMYSRCPFEEKTRSIFFVLNENKKMLICDSLMVYIL